MKQQAAVPISTFGCAKKSSFEMSSEELKEAAEAVLRRAKEKAFSKGLPIYFSRNNVCYAEYPDGRIESLNLH
jgi:hypothetical protein